MQLAEGYIGERAVDIDAGIFHKAAFLRDSFDGLDALTDQLARLTTLRSETGAKIDECARVLNTLAGRDDEGSEDGQLQAYFSDVTALKQAYREAGSFDSSITKVEPVVCHCVHKVVRLCFRVFICNDASCCCLFV